MPNCYGKVRITFNQRISIEGIKSSDINSSNTDIRILPYINPTTHDFLNFSKYNLTWTTTKLTEYEL